MVNFVLFLLGGIGVPVGEPEVDEMIRACVDNGMEKVLGALVCHHKYGRLFLERGGAITAEGWPWDAGQRINGSGWPRFWQETTWVISEHASCGSR